MEKALNHFWREVQRALPGAARSPLEQVRSRGWRSAQFRGARHQFLLRFEGPRAEAAADMFIARLPTTPLGTPEQIVADVSVVADERRAGWTRLRVEVLTVEA